MRGATLYISGLICVAMAILGGCASASTPDDLIFTRIEAVDYHDRVDLPTPSNAAQTAFGIPPSSEASQAQDANARPHRLLLKVEFTSHLNLSEFAAKNGYNVGSKAVFCAHPDDYVLLSIPIIYWRGEMVPNVVPTPESGQGSGSTFVYYTFLTAGQKATLPSDPPERPFDLRQNPENICLYLRGGNGIGFGYRSNTIVIPRDAIAAALSRAPRDLDE